MTQGMIRIQALMHETWMDVTTLPAGEERQVAFHLQDAKRQYPDHRLRAVDARGHVLDMA